MPMIMLVLLVTFLLGFFTPPQRVWSTMDMYNQYIPEGEPRHVVPVAGVAGAAIPDNAMDPVKANFTAEILKYTTNRSCETEEDDEKFYLSWDFDGGWDRGARNARDGHDVARLALRNVLVVHVHRGPHALG